PFDRSKHSAHGKPRAPLPGQETTGMLCYRIAMNPPFRLAITLTGLFEQFQYLPIECTTLPVCDMTAVKTRPVRLHLTHGQLAALSQMNQSLMHRPRTRYHFRP